MVFSSNEVTRKVGFCVAKALHVLHSVVYLHEAEEVREYKIMSLERLKAERSRGETCEAWLSIYPDSTRWRGTVGDSDGGGA